MIVGLVSTYKEGRLARAAVASLVDFCDRVFVCEGPAGDPITAEVPETDIGNYAELASVEWSTGRWRTDAKKRTAMLQGAQAWHEERRQSHDEPLWGVIVDGDEVLVNGAYLPDWLRVLDWHEELSDDPNESYLGRPIRLLELNGQTCWVRGRVLRLDRMVEYRVSTSVYVARVWDAKRGAWTHKTFADGGNVPDSYMAWASPRAQALEDDAMFVMPPLPTEPFLVHRTMLRHPLRGGLNANRMHEQERMELVKAGMKV